MSAPAMVLAAIACLLAATCGYSAFSFVATKRMRARRRRAAVRSASDGASDPVRSRELAGFALRYAESLTRRIYTGAVEPLSPIVRAGRADHSRSGRKYLKQARAAGCEKEVSAAAFCEAQARLALAGMLAGLVFGAVFSMALSVLLAALGFAFGYAWPSRSLALARRQRAVDAEQHLSEMLEVVALGLRSGLSFDLSFALYGSHFDGQFAQACGRAYRRWALGLMTREESLHRLSESYECEQLARVIDGIVRSLRLGTSLTGVLEEAASQSRANYRAALEERVAKAPVKMMLPTGTLILPAMLLLVMGPVLLELAGGF